MKTIVIWDSCGEEPLRYFVAEGDFSHLDSVYINGGGSTEDQEDELNALMWDDATQKNKVEFLDSFPKELFDQFRNEGIEVIAAGYVP